MMNIKTTVQEVGGQIITSLGIGAFVLVSVLVLLGILFLILQLLVKNWDWAEDVFTVGRYRRKGFPRCPHCDKELHKSDRATLAWVAHKEARRHEDQ